MAALGEARIRDELILPRIPPTAGVVVGLGDDAAVIDLPPPPRKLVLTTDPCPYPVANMLLEHPDFYHHGRLVVLINVSDLAAMGADPIGILISITMPEHMTTDELERFYDGVLEAASEWDCPVLGGNIKDSDDFTATGSAFGSVEPDRLTRRDGVSPGDAVCVVGPMGMFWSAAITHLKGHSEETVHFAKAYDLALFRPSAQLRASRRLSLSGLVRACTDASDGVGAALRDLAIASQIDIELHDIEVPAAVRAAARIADIDPRNLLLAWGDWQLVIGLPSEAVPNAQSLLAPLRIPLTRLGTAIEGTGRIWARDTRHRRREVRLFASDRFSASSYFTYGLDSYLSLLSEPFLH